MDEGFTATAAVGALEWPKGQGAQGRTILTTWEISFASLSHAAQELLLLCGFLANGDIPDELFGLEGELRFDWMGVGERATFGYRLPVVVDPY